jgi:hypothetical protein
VDGIVVKEFLQNVWVVSIGSTVIGGVVLYFITNTLSVRKGKVKHLEQPYVQPSVYVDTKHPLPPSAVGEKTGYATAALVLGILSLFGLYLSPAALILGIIGRKRAPSVKWRATVGMVIGIIGTVVLTALIILFASSALGDREYLNQLFN